MQKKWGLSLSGAVANDRVREAIASAERERRSQGCDRRPRVSTIVGLISSSLQWLVGR